MLAILTTHTISINFEDVAVQMNDVCTARAVQERLKKLKKMHNGAVETNSAPATPKAKEGGKPAKKRAATGSKTGSPTKRNIDEITSPTQIGGSEEMTEMIFEAASDQHSGVNDPATKANSITEEGTTEDTPIVQAATKSGAKKTPTKAKQPIKAKKAKQENETNPDDATEDGKLKAKAKTPRKTVKSTAAGATGAAKTSGKAKVKSENARDSSPTPEDDKNGIGRKRTLSEAGLESVEEE